MILIEVFGSSKARVKRKLREGEIKGVKRFGKWFVLRSDLIAYVENGEK